MCCLAEFLIKYTLIISNIIFSFAGLAIAGLGIAAHIQLNQITELIPVNLSALSISIIVLGCVVFMIAYLACCGAMRESRWMLYSYCVFMTILAAIKIYITVVVFNFLETAITTVHRWIYNAFSNEDLRPAYNVMEELFRCCGTTGANSYEGEIPNSCCGNLDNVPCTSNDDLYDGCSDIVTGWFQTFGGAIGAVLIVIIIVEVVCIIFGLHVSNTIRNKNRK